MTKRTPK